MGRTQETFNKKEVRNKKEKKRKEKEKKKLARKEKEKAGGLDDMIAYVDEHGNLSSTPPVISVISTQALVRFESKWQP